MLLCTVLLQCIHCFRVRHSKLLVIYNNHSLFNLIIYKHSAFSMLLPVSQWLCLFSAWKCITGKSVLGPKTFLIRSACPWLDDFYQNQLLRRNFNSMEIYFDTQCGINGWALAGVTFKLQENIWNHSQIFSLLSCGLFVSDGLISAFFKTDDAHGPGMEKPETVL